MNNRIELLLWALLMAELLGQALSPNTEQLKKQLGRMINVIEEDDKIRIILEIPANIDPNSIKFTYSHGVLEIIIEKRK
jgi:HSP20 family molecular chaperone IbpA